MKKQSDMLFAQLERTALKTLTAEVSETVAFGITYPAVKLFTVAELWNIQRNVKTRVSRRYL